MAGRNPPSAIMTTAPTSADILRHTSAYHRGLLCQRDLRQRLLASLLCPPASPHPDQTTAKTLLLAAKAIESSISDSAAASSSSSSLRLTETTLLSLPRQTPSSSLLLSLIHAATHRPVDAAIRLLDVFALNPSAARSEIAPVVFEDLFVYHLYPALKWFTEQRSRILSKKAPDLRRSRSSVGMGLISTMSGDEAAELKELEAAYEEVVDENTRAFALFLKEVVQGRNGRDGVDQVLPPSLVLGRIGDRSRMMNQDKSLRVEDGSVVDDSRHNQGRYNVCDTSSHFSVINCMYRKHYKQTG